MEPTSFHDWREWRRYRAVQLARLGWVHRDIAEALGISEQAVSEWLAHFAASGGQGLLSHPHGGHAKLTAQQKALIPDFLWHGAEAYGFHGEFGTCDRIVKVLQEELGVTYHKDHVARILRSLGWTPPMPLTRAVQRDEEALELWRQQQWPALRERARREGRTLVFTDESGFYLLPAVVRSYGPKGRTPLLRARQTAQILIRGLSAPPPLVQCEEVSPQAGMKKAARKVGSLAGERIGVVGHLPHLGLWAAWLIGSKKANIAMSKGGVAYITFSEKLDKGLGTLVWLVSPEWFGQR